MLSVLMMIIAVSLAIPGSLLMAYAVTGAQETLGGLMLLFAALSTIAGGLLWWAGL